ncbi:DUF3885 domain-containing protein [Myceligenerans halotolerans]
MKEWTALQQAIHDMRWGGIPTRTSQVLAGLLGFRMPEPDESWAWLTEAWGRAFPDSTASWSLRGLPDERWVRFHSLPESKRYADSEEEYQILLGRHHQILAELRGDDESDIVAVRREWFDGGRFSAPKRFRRIAATWPLWRTFADADPDSDGTPWYAFARWVPPTPAALDPLLRRVADDIDRTLFTNATVDWIYAPYDGGADVIARTAEERDALEAKYADWLSAHPSGM